MKNRKIFPLSLLQKHNPNTSFGHGDYKEGVLTLEKEGFRSPSWVGQRVVAILLIAILMIPMSTVQAFAYSMPYVTINEKLKIKGGDPKYLHLTAKSGPGVTYKYRNGVRVAFANTCMSYMWVKADRVVQSRAIMSQAGITVVNKITGKKQMVWGPQKRNNGYALPAQKDLESILSWDRPVAAYLTGWGYGLVRSPNSVPGAEPTVKLNTPDFFIQ